MVQNIRCGVTRKPTRHLAGCTRYGQRHCIGVLNLVGRIPEYKAHCQDCRKTSSMVYQRPPFVCGSMQRKCTTNARQKQRPAQHKVASPCPKGSSSGQVFRYERSWWFGAESTAADIVGLRGRDTKNTCFSASDTALTLTPSLVLLYDRRSDVRSCCRPASAVHGFGGTKEDSATDLESSLRMSEKSLPISNAGRDREQCQCQR